MFTSGTADNYADLLDRLHTFLTAKGSAFGLTYSGTGDGTLTGYSGGASSVAETFTITATSATNGYQIEASHSSSSKSWCVDTTPGQNASVHSC